MLKMCKMSMEGQCSASLLKAAAIAKTQAIGIVDDLCAAVRLSPGWLEVARVAGYGTAYTNLGACDAGFPVHP